MSKFTPALIILVIVAVLGLSGAVFVVREGEQAIVTQFGKPVGDVRYAGAHFKIPFMQEVTRFQRRILKWDGSPNQIPTKDKRYIWVDTTARWRVVEPLLFYTTVGSERGAQSRLDDIIDSVVRDAVSGHLLHELVRDKSYVPPADARDEEMALVTEVGREELLAGILREARKSMPEYGIELIDVQIKRLNYVEQVQKRVYERMISERKKVAAQFRSEGEGEKADILGQMEKELRTISSEAYRQSVEIRGDADAKAASAYADAYNRDPDLYAFLRSLESYKKAVGENSRLVLSTDSDFYRHLKSIK